MNGGKFKNAVSKFLEGEILPWQWLKTHLPHIVVIFAIATSCIWAKLKIDQTLLTVEKNKVELDSLRYVHSQKEYELIRLGRIGTVEDMLKDNGSPLGRPVKPAEIIKRRR